MEPAKGLDAFENEEIRAAGGKLDIGRTDDRSAIEMRGDLRMKRFSHAGDLLGFQNAADTSQIHLQDIGSTVHQHPLKLIFRGEAFARRHGDRGVLLHIGHILRHIWRDGSSNHKGS